MPQPFLISSFSHGLFQYYSPWLAPKDAFTDSQNVTIQQGFITVRDGLVLWNDFFTSIAKGSDSTQLNVPLPDFKPLSIQIFVNNTTYKQDKNGKFYLARGGEKLQATLNGNTVQITFPNSSYRAVFVSYTPTRLSPIRSIANFETQLPRNLGTLVFNDTDMCCFLNGDRAPNVFIKQYIRITKDDSGKVKQNYQVQIPFNFNPDTFVLSVRDNNTIYKSQYFGGFKPSGPIQNVSLNNGALNVQLNKALDPFADRIFYSAIPDSLLSNSNSAMSWDSSREFIAFTNNKDPITFFNIDELTVSRPHMPITTEAFNKDFNQIRTAKALKFFKNRLLLIAPTIYGTQSAQDGYWAQSVRWSSLYLDQLSDNSYWNFVADQYGYGGEFSPDTNEEIIGCGNVRDKLVLWFSESSYAMAPTSAHQAPFSIYKINSSLYSACTHSVTNTNTHTQILGQYGYIQSDGNASERFDLDISETIKNINFDLHYKVSAHVFSDENYLIILLFPSKNPPSSEPNSAIVYNILDKSFTTLFFPTTQVSAMGSAKSSSKTIWADMRNVPFTPALANRSFASYQHYSSTKYPVAGAIDGAIYAFSDLPTDFHAPTQSITAIPWFFKTARFSPFIQEGVSFTLNFIDIYFEGQGRPLDIIIDIFINGRSSPAKSLYVSLLADNNHQTFKRINVQTSAFFIEFVFKNNPSQVRPPKLKILGIILWAEEAGEIKDCKYLK